MKETKKRVGLRAYEKIKKKILQHELDFREKLREDDLSRELRLSRTPIREALLMLEKEGLLTRSQGRGFSIKQFSIEDVSGFYEFRDISETGSAELVIANITDEDIDELSNILKKVKGIINKGDAGEALVVALQFHIKIIKISKNDMIIDSLKNCYEKMILVSWSSHQIEAAIESAKEHERILSALKSKDLDELRMRTHQHIINARDRILNILKSNTQKLYFLP